MLMTKDRPIGRTRAAQFSSPSHLRLGYGRFMQADPLGYQAGLNFYGYVGGDPINLLDPYGLYVVCRQSSEKSSDPGEIVVNGIICQDNGLAIPQYIYVVNYVADLLDGKGHEPVFTVLPDLVKPVVPDETCTTESDDGSTEIESNRTTLSAFEGGIPGHVHNGSRELSPGPDDGQAATASPTGQAFVGTKAGVYLITREGPGNYSIGIVQSFKGSPSSVVQKLGSALSSSIQTWNKYNGLSGPVPVYQNKAKGKTTCKKN